MRFDAFRSITEPQTNKDFSLILELSTKEGTLENNYSNDSSLNNQMDAGTCFKSLRYASYLISASSLSDQVPVIHSSCSLQLLYNFGLELSDLD